MRPRGQWISSLTLALAIGKSCNTGVPGPMPIAHRMVTSMVPAWETTTTRSPTWRATIASVTAMTRTANSRIVSPSGASVRSGCHASRSSRRSRSCFMVRLGSAMLPNRYSSRRSSTVIGSPVAALISPAVSRARGAGLA